MKRLSNRPNQRGFTLVELLLATAFFSFVLIFILTGFIQVNRSYNKGIVVKRVQETARLLMEDIVRNVRVANSVSWYDQGSGPYRLCLDNVQYAWNTVATGEPLDAGAAEPIVYKGQNAPDDCSNPGSIPSFDASSPVINGTSLLEDGVVVQAIDIEPVTSSSGNSYVITVVLSADEDTTGGLNAECPPGIDLQFCDVVRLQSIVSSLESAS